MCQFDLETLFSISFLAWYKKQKQKVLHLKKCARKNRNVSSRVEKQKLDSIKVNHPTNKLNSSKL